MKEEKSVHPAIAQYLLDSMPTSLSEKQPSAGAVDERAAFETWYETTYGISLEPEFRANHFIGYVNDKANHRWTAWKARAALTAGRAAVPFDLKEFAKRAAVEMEKHDFHGFEPVVLAVVEDMLAAAAPSKQQQGEKP